MKGFLSKSALNRIRITDIIPPCFSSLRYSVLLVFAVSLAIAISFGIWKAAADNQADLDLEQTNQIIYYQQKTNQYINENLLPLIMPRYEAYIDTAEFSSLDQVLDFLDTAFVTDNAIEIHALKNIQKAHHYVREGSMDEAGIVIQILKEALTNLEPQTYLQSVVLSTIGSYYMVNQAYSTSKRYFLNAAEVIDTQKFNFHYYYSKTLANIVAAYHGANENQEAVDYYSNYLAFIKKTGRAEIIATLRIIDSYLFASERLGNFQQALWARSFITTLFSRVKNPDDPRLQRDYYRFCMNFIDAGDYDTALEYINQAIRIRQSNGNAISITIEHLLLYKAEILELTHDFRGASELYEEILRGYDSFSVEDQCFYSSMYAIFLQKTKEYSKARMLIERGFTSSYQKLGSTSLFLGILLQVSAISSLHEGDTIRAYKELWSAMQAYKANYQGAHYEIGIIHQSLSDIHAGLGRLDSALYHIQKSIINCSAGFENMDYRSNPRPEQVLPLEYSLLGLEQKCALLIRKYGQEGDTEALRQSLASSFLLIQVIDTMQQLLPMKEEQLGFSNRFGQAYKAGMYCAVELYHRTGSLSMLDTAWLISEHAKARVLRQTLNEIIVSKVNTRNNAASMRLNGLLRKISETRQQISAMEETGQAAGIAYESLQRRLFREKRDYTAALNDIRIKHPEYYRQSSSRPVANLWQSMKSLGEDKTQLSYFDADTVIYCFAMTRNKVQLGSIRSDTIFRTRVHSFRRLMDSGDYRTNLSRSCKSFVSISTALHRNILDPFSGIIGKNGLIIIPDGILSHIPFALLIDPRKLNVSSSGELGQFRHLPYMFRDRPIAYSNSSSLLTFNNGKKPGLFNRVLSIAPDYSDVGGGDLLLKLNGATREVSSIRKEFNGTFLTGEEASKEAFIRKLPGHSILHLATHATLDDANPLYNRIELSCEDSTISCGLYVYELFSLRTDARLAVLSGCETAMGSYSKGEGMISLSSGFMMAGCNSTTVSLWKVPDEGGASLMGYYFKRLSQNLPKDEALRLAQLDFLDYEEESRIFPANWGMFLVIGDCSPIGGRKGIALSSAAVVLVLVLSGIAISCRLILFASV